MKKALLPLFVVASAISLFAQTNKNITLISQTNEFPNSGYTDIWGYVHADGTEYAILGLETGTAIYDLTDHSQPELATFIQGSFSRWRDMKSFGDYVYVVADEGSDGLLVINMSNAPNDITWELWKPQIIIDNEASILQQCHNLYIDEKGYAYLSGCSPINKGGILIVDLVTTPGSPIYLGAADSRYSHDNFTRDNITWSADINNGVFSVIDVSDPTDPVTIATQNTTFNFTHNCWLSDDNNFLFTTDERANSYVDVYDVSDLSDIKLVDKFRPLATEGLGVIPHNTHFLDDYLVTSWYTDGLIIVDAHRPDILVEVGNYDTWDGAHGGTNGCWGAYPFLPSGYVLASDRASGLYIFEVDYKRAAYLEGIIRDSLSGLPINNANFRLPGTLIDEFSDPFGQYKAGLLDAGTYQIEFSHPAYYPKTITINISNGQTTVTDVELNPLPSGTFSGTVVDKQDGSTIPGAQVFLFNDVFAFETQTDANGDFTFNRAVFDTYELFVGSWGHLHLLQEININENQVSATVRLDQGYQDDFFRDFGWETSTLGPITTGQWMRGEPIGTNFNGSISNPEFDIIGDIGDACYVTDNRGFGAADTDVDDGEAILTSPIMDLSNYGDPVLSFSYWFFNSGGVPPRNDQLSVTVDNGVSNVVIDVFNQSQSSWREVTDIHLGDLIELTSKMTIIYQTGDQDSTGHILEAGVDGFLIVDADNTTSIGEQALSPIEVTAFPNPFRHQISVSYTFPDHANSANLRLFNSLGQLVETYALDTFQGTLSLGHQLQAGLYLIQIELDGQTQQVLKVLKE